jgi:hypothetical protein
MTGTARQLFERSVNEVSSGLPGYIEKHREPGGQAWAAFSFGSFSLGKQRK